MITIGFSQDYDTKVAVYAAVNQCDLTDVALVFVFAAARHDPSLVLSALQSKLPEVPVFGGSVVGTITRNNVSYSGYEMAVVVFSSGPDVPLVVNSDPDEYTDGMIGRSLGHALNGLVEKSSSLLLFYTSVADVQTKALHHATTILEGLSSVVNNLELQIVGGGLLTGFNFEDSWAIAHSKVHRHYAFAILFPKHIKCKVNILRACQPAGPIMTITEIDGSRVLSIDNKPALDVICMLLDRKPSLASNILGLNLCLGLVKKHNSGMENDKNQINRVIVSENVNENSISLLEPDFNVGDCVQLMFRDNDYMISNSHVLEKDRPIFSMYVDCAGRASVLTGSLEEEGLIAMSSLPENTPSIGIYSGVEIATIENRPTALDLTGVMISLVKT